MKFISRITITLLISINLFCLPPFETFQTNGNRVFLLNSENLSRFQFIQLIEYFKEQNIKIDRVMIDENKDFVDRYNKESKKIFSFFQSLKLPNYKYTEFLSSNAYVFSLETLSINKQDKEGNTELHNLLQDKKIEEEKLKKEILKLICQGANIKKRNILNQTCFELMLRSDKGQKVLQYLIETTNTDEIESTFKNLKQLHSRFLNKTNLESLLDFHLFLALHCCTSDLPIIGFLEDKEDISLKHLFEKIKHETKIFEKHLYKLKDNNIIEKIIEFIVEIETTIDSLAKIVENHVNVNGVAQELGVNFIDSIKEWFVNNKCNSKTNYKKDLDMLTNFSALFFYDFSLKNNNELQTLYENFLQFMHKYQQEITSVKIKHKITLLLTEPIIKICTLLCCIKILSYLDTNNDKNILLILNKKNFEFTNNLFRTFDFKQF
ncbi:hypothetical protein M1446_03390 [Candidatus Dependentiae bacterium]|nr:hypothetical protein [Candidatus Dependentiae bacterium]